MLTDPAIRSQIKTAQKLYQRLVENMPEPSTTQALKQAGAKATKILSDGGTGLNLAVYGSTGNATWQFYHRTGGKQRKVTIGRYPAIPLGAARDQVRQWRDAIDRGQDPFAKKTGEKITVTELCQRYIESHAVYELRARSLESALSYLGFRQKDGVLVATGRLHTIVQEWGNRTVASIQPTDVFDLIDRVKTTGHMATANKTLNHIKALFGWAVPRYLAISPCSNIKKKDAGGADKKRKRTLSPAELKQIWDAVDELELQSDNYTPAVGAFRLLILTGQRASIVATARHEYFDLNEGTWTIPEEQEGTKGIGNLLPLTDTIRTIVRDTPHKSGYLISNDGGMRPVCLAGAKRRLDAIIAAKGTIAPWRLHDLRRTFRTLSSAVAIPAGDATRERLIGHKIGGMDEIYNQHAYFEEKGEALRMMEAKIRSIVTPPPANVIDLRSHASCASR